MGTIISRLLKFSSDRNFWKRGYLLRFTASDLTYVSCLRCLILFPVYATILDIHFVFVFSLSLREQKGICGSLKVIPMLETEEIQEFCLVLMTRQALKVSRFVIHLAIIPALSHFLFAFFTLPLRETFFILFGNHDLFLPVHVNSIYRHHC